jgi:hypothetical protein
MPTLLAQSPVPSPQPPPAPPSRRDNPFATCWTRPGRIAYQFVAGESVEHLVAKLAAQNWRGAILGPHGSGKSTLLETLRPAIIAAGKDVQTIALHDGQRRLPSAFFPRPITPHLVLIIDGYEQLSWLERWRLARCCNRTKCGLIVTAHAPTRYATVIQLAPNLGLIEHLAATLCAEVSTLVTREDVAASHDCHGSNVREIFFDLYDRLEQRRQATRTAAVSQS